MTVRKVERDVEEAMIATIQDRLTTDGVTGVSFDTLLTGAPGSEPEYPYVYVMCRPLANEGAKTLQWSGEASVVIMTKHLTGVDRDAQKLDEIFGSVAFSLDFDDFSPNTSRIRSLQLRRTGGSYTFSDSTNELIIDVEIIKACGSK